MEQNSKYHHFFFAIALQFCPTISCGSSHGLFTGQLPQEACQLGESKLALVRLGLTIAEHEQSVGILGERLLQPKSPPHGLPIHGPVQYAHD